VKDWWLLTPARRREVEGMLEKMGRWEEGESSSDDGDEDPIVVELEWEDGRRLVLNPFHEG
jgi:hypothetical protein